MMKDLVTHRMRLALVSQLALLVSCTFNVEGKNRCETQADCLSGFRCVDFVCSDDQGPHSPDVGDVRADAEPTPDVSEGGAGMMAIEPPGAASMDSSVDAGDGDAADGSSSEAGPVVPPEPMDTTAPGPVRLALDSGEYAPLPTNCIDVLDVEDGASVHMEWTADDSEPDEPDADSPALGTVNRGGLIVHVLCVQSHPQLRVRIAQVDAAGNVGPASEYSYHFDRSAPALLGAPATGYYNVATAFDCVTITGIEPSGHARYERDFEGSWPQEPSEESPRLTSDDNELCGLQQNGINRLYIRHFDAVGNAAPTQYLTWTIDTTPPTVSFQQDASGTLYTGQRVRFTLDAHGDLVGAASVTFGEYSVELSDATQPDPNDGVYRGSFVVPKGIEVANLPVAVEFRDRAGNVAYTSGSPLSFDGVGPEQGGRIVTADETWSAADSPHFVGSDMRFDPGADLTVEPGAVVVFENDSTIALYAGVTLVGTSNAPIELNGGTLRIESLQDGASYDAATSAYVAGPRFEHLRAASTTIEVLDLFASTYGTVYVAHSTLEAVLGKFPDSSWGSIIADVRNSYVGYSTIGSVRTTWQGSASYRVDLTGSRIEQSYIGTIDAYVPGELRRNQISTLTGMGLGDNVHHNSIGSIVMSVTALHNNTILRLELPTTSGSTSTRDITGNYWGAGTTAEMNAEGSESNIVEIIDARDDISRPLVDYSGWLQAPAPDTGPSW